MAEKIPKNSIKYYTSKFISLNKERLKDKVVLDIPAGEGDTSRKLKSAGARVVPFDIFPEYFDVEGLECSKIDITEGIPVDDSFANFIICEEGIEHFSDQLSTLKEFNRVLNQDGSLIITTPNYSNLQNKLSYLLTESEYFYKILPPNELDTLWLPTKDSPIYYLGHAFLTGIQRLRFLAKLAGFDIKKIHFARARNTSMFLLPVLYPMILISNLYLYYKGITKGSGVEKGADVDAKTRKKIYKEILYHNINPKILVDSHLFIEFEKKMELDEVSSYLSRLRKT